MDKIKTTGDLLIETPDNFSERIPDSVVGRMERKRLLDTTYGVFRLNRQNQIVDQVQMYQLSSIELENFSNEGQIDITLLEDSGTIYYTADGSDPSSKSISKGDRFVLDTDELELENSVDSNIVLEVTEINRVDGEGTVEEKLGVLVNGSDRTLSSKKCVLKHGSQNRRVIMSDSKVRDLIESHVLRRVYTVS